MEPGVAHVFMTGSICRRLGRKAILHLVLLQLLPIMFVQVLKPLPDAHRLVSSLRELGHVFLISGRVHFGCDGGCCVAFS